MSAFAIRDRHTYCPDCCENNSDYVVIPPSQLTYTDAEGASVTEHFGELRDYKCRNCSHTWMMPESIFATLSDDLAR